MGTYGTTAAASNELSLLKPIFDDGVQELIQNEVKILKYAQKNGDDVNLDGQKFTWNVHLTKNDNSQNFDPSQALPPSSIATFAQASMSLSRIAQPLQIDHELRLQADRDVAAFSTKVAILSDDAQAALAKTMNRQVGADNNAIVGVTNASWTGAGTASGTMTVTSVGFIEVGAYYDIWAGSGGLATGTAPRNTAPAYLTVTKVVPSTGVCSIAMSDGSNIPAGVTSGDVIVKFNALYYSSAIISREINGIRGFTASGTSLFGIDPTVAGQHRWNGNRYDNQNTAIQPYSFVQAQIQARRNTSSKGKYTVCFTSPEQAAKLVYGASGTYADIRFTKGDVNKPGVNVPGTINVGSAQIPLEDDIDLPTDRFLCFDESALIYGELHPVRLEEWGGTTSLPVLSQGTSSTGYVAADTMWYVWRGNLGCYRRNDFTEIFNCA